MVDSFASKSTQATDLQESIPFTNTCNDDNNEDNDEDTSKNHVDYRDQGGPALSLLWPSSNEQLTGQSLYLGGEVGSDGNIYCIPGHAKRVLVIQPSNDQVYPIGPILPGKFKWLRGVVSKQVIYGLPCHADTVLKINVTTKEITKLMIPYDEFYHSTEISSAQRHMEWKYHGGTTSPKDDCIYAIPQSAWHVLRIDPKTDTCSFVPSEPMKGRYKFYGGLVGKQDGAIYGIPHNATSVLRIDPSQTQVVTLHGHFGEGRHKWHGAASASDGTIVSVPANADSVLCITPATPEPLLFELGSSDVVQTGRHRSDGKYKYLGAMKGTNGKIYCFPSGAEYTLEIDTLTRQVRNVGPNLVDTQMEIKIQNKWQNGLTSTDDQCVYAIPLSAETVLKIDTSSEGEPQISTWRLPASHREVLAKWEGGTIAPNGAMYCMPNNHKAVLKITPSQPL